MKVTPDEKTKIVAGVELSGVFMVVVTPDFIQSLYDPDSSERFQLEAMRMHTERPVLLLWVDVNEEQRHLVRESFREFHTLREAELNEFMSDQVKAKSLITELVSSGKASAA